MKRGRIIRTFVVGAVLAVIAAVLFHTNTKPTLGAGPIINGQTVTAWIDSIQTANFEDPAITNLIGTGEPAVPYLVRAVEWQPSTLNGLGGVVWKHAGWAARRLHLPHPEETRQRRTSKRGAMQVLANLGPDAKDALPVLRTVGRDPDWGTRGFALSAIASIGPEPNDIPMLIKALTDTNLLVRIQGARGLGNLGFQSKESISALRNALHDEHASVRKFASEALTKIDPKATEKAGAQ